MKKYRTDRRRTALFLHSDLYSGFYCLQCPLFHISFHTLSPPRCFMQQAGISFWHPAVDARCLVSPALWQNVLLSHTAISIFPCHSPNRTSNRSDLERHAWPLFHARHLHHMASSGPAVHLACTPSFYKASYIFSIPLAKTKIFWQKLKLIS